MFKVIFAVGLLFSDGILTVSLAGDILFLSFDDN